MLITIDTLRADRLGTYGHARDVSPFLDQLAARSVVFERAYASASHTAPSHASLFTGLQPAQHKVRRNGESLDPNVVTLARRYQRAGYRTAAFAAAQFLSGVSSGFEQFDALGRFRPADEIFDRAGRWLDSLRDDERAFLWIHLFDVHHWYREDIVDVATRDEVIAQTDRKRMRNFLRKRRRLSRRHLRRPREFWSIQDSYDGQILSTDRAVRRFFERTEWRSSERGGAALWIVTSDHGEGLGNHGSVGHGAHLYNEQLWVPLIVHSSDGRFEPSRVTGDVRLVDVVPTLIDLEPRLDSEIEIPSTPSLVGRTLLPMLRGEELAGPSAPVFAQRRPSDRTKRRRWRRGEVFSLQRSGEKVIHFPDGGHELYDLEVDPFELNNVFDAEDAEHRELVTAAILHFRDLARQGDSVSSSEIADEHREELEALGYL